MFNAKLLSIAETRVNELKEEINRLRKLEVEGVRAEERNFASKAIVSAKDWLTFNEWIIQQKGNISFGHPYGVTDYLPRPWHKKSEGKF